MPDVDDTYSYADIDERGKLWHENHLSVNMDVHLTRING